MERRFISQNNALINLETRADGSDGIISGYSAVYYRKGDKSTEYDLWDGAVERIKEGAFERAIKEADDVRGLFNHDPSLILARTASGTMKLTSDANGLRYEIQPADTTISRDVREHIKRGDVTGSSFAFTVTDEEWRTEEGIEVREITGVKLYDSGPVTYPAYAGTTADTRSDEARNSFDAILELRNKDTAKATAIAVRARLVDLGLA